MEETIEQSLGTLPVQSGGRIKPLDTLARETVRSVTGKSGTHPVATLVGWWADPDLAQAEPLIEFRDIDSKQELGLDPDRRWYSLVELRDNAALDERGDLIRRRLQGDEELPASDQKVQELLVKMFLLEETLNGSLWKIVPHPDGMEESWASLTDLGRGKLQPKFAEAYQAVIDLRTAIASGDAVRVNQTAAAARQQLAQLGPTPSVEALEREQQYNATHPFQKAWMLYLAGFLVLLFSPTAGARSRSYRAGVVLIVAGFLVHCYGFGLRCLIAGRPPVTNMYESVIWVAFGAVLFAFVLEWGAPRKYYLLSASASATLCLILADLLPTVLDPAIHPLTPVLRSNFWLTVHVLTITLGYAAFLLALGLGHAALWISARTPGKKDAAALLHDTTYKAIQIGVVFLAAGTILGGVWANFSWGRFWGWDPKEVWALIALLGYLAILHGRYAGWLRKFGVTAWSVLAFQGVLMAWYGVNYVLGTGLHSYGFGTGGGQYVAGFVVFELAFVAWATVSYHSQQVTLMQTGASGCPFTRMTMIVKQMSQGET